MDLSTRAGCRRGAARLGRITPDDEVCHRLALAGSAGRGSSHASALFPAAKPCQKNGMTALMTLDLAALVWFLIAWSAFGWLTDYSRAHRGSMSRLMDDNRRRWMASMLARDVRIVDTAIMTSLQNGTAFFASTSLLAFGGTMTLLNQSDRILALYSEIPIMIETSRPMFELKVLGLGGLFGYAFFKFGWSYRLYNYAAILIGAVPPQPLEDVAGAERAMERAATMQIEAGHHFHWGLRSLFFSIGYMGWFLGPVVFFITTTIIVVVMTHRQFYSRARTVLLD